MSRISIVLSLAILFFASSACTPSDDTNHTGEQADGAGEQVANKTDELIPVEAPQEAAPADSDSGETKKEPLVFPLEEGVVYYDGGPLVRYDKYERMRVYSYRGETTEPSVEGVVMGHRDLPDNRFEMTTIINGSLIARNFGFFDENQNMWYDRRLGYYGGNLILEMLVDNDDETQIITIVRKDLDPKTGELIRETEYSAPYTPPPAPEDEEDDDEDFEIESEQVFIFGQGADDDTEDDTEDDGSSAPDEAQDAAPEQ
ncbi:MAG: hypothetical protein ACI8TX_001628 [Hyphomicrobiaceae bacterium]|jgi:hypothetical protein